MKQEVDKKTALIVGLGASGLACAHHLGRRGWKIRAADTREAPAGAQRLGAEMPDAEIRTGGLPESLLDGVSLVVMSPGFPPASVRLHRLSRAPGPATLRSWARSNSSPERSQTLRPARVTAPS